MQGFTNISALVMETLTSEPLTRNSDNLLFHQVCKILLERQGVDIELLGFSKLFLSLKKYNLPQFETVGRIRRKLQHDITGLGCNQATSIERGLNEDSFRQYAKDGD